MTKLQVCEAVISTWPKSVGWQVQPDLILIPGAWSVYADRGGKPGWIATNRSGAALEFDIRLGRSPTVALVWVQSYGGGWGR